MTRQNLIAGDNNRMPWYRIHIVTCLAVMVFGAELLWCQREVNTGRPLYGSIQEGWPLSWRYESKLQLRWFIFFTDAASAFALLIGTGFIIERLIRRTTSPLQFSLTVAVRFRCVGAKRSNHIDTLILSPPARRAQTHQWIRFA